MNRHIEPGGFSSFINFHGSDAVDDPEHSDQEDRFALLGLSAMLRTLVVVHCYREEEAVIRIISARKATRRERDVYNRRWRA